MARMGGWHFPSLTIALPDWVEEILPDPHQRMATEEEAMGVAIALSRRNVERGTGGTFGAVILEASTGRVLVSSTEPCAMCLGAVTWSGVRRLVCGASDADARAIGFDEGIKASDWPERLRQRGITVRQGVCRAQAVDVLNAYQAGGGLIYNGRGAAR
jgi:tRNA(Arg) A34 adenosine deaminase TadA